MTPRVPCLLALAALAGCSTTILQPMNPTALQAHTALPTTGGYELELEPGGGLVSRPAGDDVEAALGATLEETDDGLRVTGLLRAESPLQEGDVILRARARHPAAMHPEAYLQRRDALAARLTAMSKSPELTRGQRVQLLIQRQALFAGESVRDIAPLTSAALVQGGHAVHGLEDLRGYGLGWTALDLLVQRGDQTVPTRTEVGRPEPVAHRLWHPDVTRALGFEAALVDSFPEHLRPVRTGARLKQGDLLVTWVAVDSPEAIRGLRPLSLIQGVGPGPDDLYGDEKSVWLPGADSPQPWKFAPPEHPTDLDVLFTFLDVESDPVRTRVNVGPLGALLGYASEYVYNPRTDRYAQATSLSVGYTVFGYGSVSGDGRSDYSSTRIALIAGNPRTTIDMAGPAFRGPFFFSWDDDKAQDHSRKD